MNYRDTALQHLAVFFAGHPSNEQRWEAGPMAADSDFFVMCFAPGPKTGLWAYFSVGAELLEADAPRLEFFVLSPRFDTRMVELVTMIAHYHRTERLGLSHLLPIGAPWLDCSSCDCFLVSLPYSFGPALEHLDYGTGSARFLWLLPITSSERQFAKEHGVEALEERFDQAQLQYWDINRTSVE
jgi:hypothetical protein